MEYKSNKTGLWIGLLAITLIGTTGCKRERKAIVPPPEPPSAEEIAAKQARAKAAEEVMREFQAAYPLAQKILDEYGFIENCMWGDQRYDAETLELKKKHVRCLETCKKRFGKSDKRKRQYWNCQGPCYQRVGGKRTFKARAECYAEYVKRIEPIGAQAKARMATLGGCAKEIWASIADGVDKASTAAVEPLSAKPPKPVAWEVKDAMSKCTHQYFNCMGGPCGAKALSGVIGVTDSLLLPQGHPMNRLYSVDGDEISRQSQVIAKKEK